MQCRISITRYKLMLDIYLIIVSLHIVKTFSFSYIVVRVKTSTHGLVYVYIGRHNIQTHGLGLGLHW